MVVRELLTCTQPNRHETSTALWNPYRRVSLRRRCAQIHFSRGARAKKKQKTTVRHLVLQRKYMDFRARFAQCYCTIIYRNAIVHICFFLRGTTAVEAPRRRAASARILYIYIVYVCQAMVYVRTYIVCICTHD